MARKLMRYFVVGKILGSNELAQIFEILSDDLQHVCLSLYFRSLSHRLG